MDAAFVKAKLEEIDARIAGNALEQVAEPGAEQPEEYYECLAVQRRYLEGCKQRARNRLSAFTSPNPRDLETHVELQYINEAAMSFCNAPFFGARPATVDECAERMIAAETANNTKDRKIDELDDYINELKDEVLRTRGQHK
jgi:hypothetical protein